MTEASSKGRDELAEAVDQVVMIYDGDCGFCTYWARYFFEKMEGQMEIVPLQDEQRRPPGLKTSELEEALHTVEPDGTVRRGAAAVFSALARRRRYAPWWWLYRWIPPFRWVSELVYRLVAHNRMFVSRWTRWMRRDDT